jgi:prophage tail gpP-like protein
VSKDLISLKINGKDFNKDWDNIKVTRSLDQMCSSFDFTTTQDTPFDPQAWPIQMGAECTVYVADTLVSTGYIEDINIDYNKDSHTVTVAGRDKTADLVDCSRVSGATSWSDVSVLSVIKELCRPHGITVSVSPNATAAMGRGLHKAIKFDVGSPIIEKILMLTKIFEVFPMSTEDGNLLLTQTGTIVNIDVLKRGVNILTGALKQSNKERFSHYYVKGIGIVNDSKTPNDWVKNNSRFVDPEINELRYRPMASVAQTDVDIAGCKGRAQWEAKYRAANSRLYGYTVQGWTQSDGKTLWKPNTLVQIDDPTFGIPNVKLNIKGTFLINAVEYKQTSQGTVSILQVCSPEKYKAFAQLEKMKTIFDTRKE